MAADANFNYPTEYKFKSIDIIVDGESLCQYLINNHCATLYENGDRNKIKAKHIINMKILKEQGKL